VVAPPYDVISERMREELYRLSPHNVVRVILGKERKGDNRAANKYKRAARYLDSWIENAILRRDDKEALYLYQQNYLYKSGLKKRIGFIGLMKIEDPSSSLVLPHEYTFSKPKADRFNLIKETKANTSPIFCIFRDSGDKVTSSLRSAASSAAPAIDIELEGVRHRVWKLTDRKRISRISKAMASKQVFIADGHHRYEVALAYRNRMRRLLKKKDAGPYENVMVYFSSLTDENLVIFSTYRVIKSLGKMKWQDIEKRLSGYFTVSRVRDGETMFAKLEKVKSGYAFGIYYKDGGFRVIKLKDSSVLDEVIKADKSRVWKRLNVTVLHFLVFDHILKVDKTRANDKNIIYTKDEKHAVRLVDEGTCDIAFFQLPTKVDEVRNIARNGDRMPHKSTYFYPKLLTGLVLNKF